MLFEGFVDGLVMKLFGVLAYHAIEDGRCEIRDDFVQGLHPDQKSIEFFQG